MRKLLTVAVLAAIAAVSCGFSDLGVEASLGVYRGEPVREALAKLGRPMRIAYAERQRIYYWRAYVIGDACKIWGAAERGVIVNWGYQSCYR